jgi:flagellar M-ring protein FliF
MSLGPQMEQVRGVWLGLTPDRRRLLIVVGAVAATLVAAVVAVSSYVPYTTVYTNLSPASAGQVVNALQGLKVPYRLVGTNIEVPAAMADQVRVELATQNLPQQGEIGYQNVLSSLGFGMTDQQFNLAVLNALQDDLAATISTMQGVNSADVQIVEPPQSAFVQTSTGVASASVYVNVAPAQALPPSEVNGIEQLVAHAVPGLNAQNVAVVDQAGQLLSASPSTAAAGTPGGELGTEQAVENALNQRIAALITPVTGPGNVVVAVHANLSFQQTSTTEQLNSTATGGGGITSKTTQTTTFKGTGGVSIPAGTSGNVPTYPTTTGGGGNSNYTTQSTTVQYAVNHILRQIHSPPMTVNGFTVSVMVNQRAYPLTPARTAQLRSLVATAIGLPANSPLAAQDISVAAAPFAGVPIPTTKVPTSALPLPLPILAGAGGGALLLVVAVLFLLMRRRGRGRVPAAPAPLPAQAQAQAFVIERPPTPDPNVERERRLIETVTESARTQPEEVANLLRGWLREEP